jgi:hypothetical protein
MSGDPWTRNVGGEVGQPLEISEMTGEQLGYVADCVAGDVNGPTVAPRNNTSKGSQKELKNKN